MTSAAAKRDTAATPGSHARNENARVLIVDDDATMRMLCALSLDVDGVVVVEATDGKAALAQARSACPDLVLTDVMMPGLTGFELAEALRRDARTSRVPVIFVSGEPRVPNESRARQLGAFAYVSKPSEPGALASLVAKALGRGDATSVAAA